MDNELFSPIHHSPVNCDEYDLADVGPGLLARAISQSKPGYPELEEIFFPEAKK